MWVRTENGEDVRPAEKEDCGDIVIVRKNFSRIAETAEKPAHYEYDEWQMPLELFGIYKDYEERTNEQSDTLIELAELISEVI